MPSGGLSLWAPYCAPGSAFLRPRPRLRVRALRRLPRPNPCRSDALGCLRRRGNADFGLENACTVGGPVTASLFARSAQTTRPTELISKGVGKKSKSSPQLCLKNHGQTGELSRVYPALEPSLQGLCPCNLDEDSSVHRMSPCTD
ncbi:uncharacterized protein LOC143413050 [Maylandia zebra]|uniref:uncharacterized protein LOC143413050 n=1 Tax=Maylandia zebra TaxID=106582 RepID=UPI00403CAFAF